MSDECNTVCESLISCPVTVDEGDVVKFLSRINPRKAPGPDGLKGRVLRVCAEQLGRVFTHTFQMFLNVHFIPHSWKMSTVTPLPQFFYGFLISVQYHPTTCFDKMALGS